LPGTGTLPDRTSHRPEAEHQTVGAPG
jgi:hypothetical protein